jgi:hypothetical protein
MLFQGGSIKVLVVRVDTTLRPVLDAAQLYWGHLGCSEVSVLYGRTVAGSGSHAPKGGVREIAGSPVLEAAGYRLFGRALDMQSQ